MYRPAVIEYGLPGKKKRCKQKYNLQNSEILKFLRNIMELNVTEVTKNRGDFLQHLENDINQYEQTIQTLTKEQQELESLISNLKHLKTYPEHEALIPLGKNIYLKGRIQHTGEYYIKKTAYPDSIVMLQSADKTIGKLNEENKSIEDDIDKVEYSKFQIEERIKVLKGEETFQAEINDMPKEIKSDRGVAVKVGDCYEILEFED